MSAQVRNVSEVAGGTFEGEYVNVASLVDHDLLIRRVEKISTRFGDAVAVEAHDNTTDKDVYFITSTVVIMRKLLQCKDKDALPVSGMIVKVAGKRYYDIL